MFLTARELSRLETPCVVIDVDRAKKNISALQAECGRRGVALRPHVKTHKMIPFARMQVQAGARGITACKVSEAEVMADGGLDDIFIAYPMVGDFRVRRAIALHRRIKRLILAVDSLEGARALNAAAEEAGVTLEVRLEVDTGARRTGSPRDEALSLALDIAHTMKHLRLTGIYTFKSLILDGRPTRDNALAGQEEGRLMGDTARALRNAGIDIRDVSAGSTPTGLTCADTGLVTEIRPGTYIFGDLMMVREHAAAPDEVAARIYATVVSTPGGQYAVIDGGTKTFPMDITPMTAPDYYPGYAAVVGRDDLHLLRMNEEHGMITCDGPELGLRVGQKLELMPIHVCPAVNLQNEVYLLENGALTKQKVDARGMLV